MLENLDVQNRFNSPRFGSATGSFGMNPQVSAAIPPMQSIDANTINEAATDTYLGQRLNSFSDVDPLLQFGVTIPTWVAINQAMERYNKYCRGDYDKSVIAKFGQAGDKISKFLFDNDFGRWLEKKASSGNTLFKKHIYDNSALIRAFDKTPSLPELKFVRHQMLGMPGTLSSDAVTILEGYLKPLKAAKDFDSIGATKAQIEQIEQGLSKITDTEARNLYLQTEEFKILNKNATPQQINGFKNLDLAGRIKHLNELKLKSLGVTSEEFATIKADPYKNIKELLKIFGRNKNKSSRLSYSDKNLGTKAAGELIGRKVEFSETYNKLYSAMGGNHTTKLGRTMAQLSNYILEGASSRISGGKVAALMQAFFLAEVLIRANRQEGASNKFKSFMERFAELIGFFVFIGPSIKLMHKIGGLQYSGMNKEQIEVYRRALKEFNDHVMNCDWTKDIYKAERKKLRSLFRPKTRNPFVYLARKTGDILTVGLEQVRPYTKHKVEKVDLTITKVMENPMQYFKNIPKRLKDVARNPKYWLKQMSGYPVRFLAPMVIIMPFFNKYLVKGINSIFGKPKEGALADEGKYEEEQEKINNSPSTQPEVHYAQQAPAVAPVNVTAAAGNNAAQISHTGNPNNSSNSDSQNNNKQDKQPDIPANRYIPSSNPVEIKSDANIDPAIAKLLKRADLAEKNAMDALSM